MVRKRKEEETGTNPIEEKAPSEEQMKKENNTFKTIIIVMIGCILVFSAVYAMIYYTNNFEVNLVNFNVIKMGPLTLYKTSLPVTYNLTKADYNFFLRTDPRVLVNIPFNGNMVFQKDAVINMTNDFNCGGDGIIAIANMQTLYNLIGTKMIKDDNAGCDAEGRYVFLRIKEGNETKIEQFGTACYDISISNCEILKGTERLMLENFMEINKRLEG